MSVKNAVNPKSPAFSALLVLTAGCLWGFMGLLVRSTDSLGLGSMETCFLRALVTAAVMLILLLLFDRPALKVRLPFAPYSHGHSGPLPFVRQGPPGPGKRHGLHPGLRRTGGGHSSGPGVVLGKTGLLEHAGHCSCAFLHSADKPRQQGGEEAGLSPVQKAKKAYAPVSLLENRGVFYFWFAFRLYLFPAVAGHLTAAYIPQPGLLPAAAFRGVGAAGVEAAAGGRVYGAGQLAL